MSDEHAQTAFPDPRAICEDAERAGKMDEQQYFLARVDHEQRWYSDKSTWNEQRYQFLRIVELASAATIPFIVTLGEAPAYRIIAGSLGVVVTLAAGVQSLFRFHENWINYRSTSEKLKHERFAYLTKSVPYDVDGSLQHLVERVESLVSREHAQWGKRMLELPRAEGQQETGARAAKPAEPKTGTTRPTTPTEPESV